MPKRVERNGEARRVEVAVGQHFVRSRRPPADSRPRCSIPARRDRAPNARGERGAVHLRDAAKRQRVLHPARDARLPQRAAGEQTRQAARPRHSVRAPAAPPAPAGRAGSGWRESLRTTAPRRRSAHRARATHRGATSAAWPTVAAFELMSARPSLPVSVAGCEACLRERCRARHRRAAVLGFALADERQREMRQRREIGGADRADAGHDRMHAGVEHRDRAHRAPPAKRPSRPRPCRRRGRTSSRAPHPWQSADRCRRRAPARRAPGRRPARRASIFWPVLAPSAVVRP